MTNLILITSEFPYYSGEPFLLNELPYLSRNYDKIYIFSINGSVKEEITRDLPDNAICFPLGTTISKAKYIEYFAKGFRRPHSDLRIRNIELKRIAASVYTRGRASEIAEKIYQIIKKNELIVSNATIYSFWFSYQAIAAWLLSIKLNKEGNRTIALSRAHGYDLYWERAIGGYLPFQDISLRHLSCCFPCSNNGREYLLQKYPWASEKIITARLGTKDNGLNPYNGELTFATCCNLESLKRMTLFAEAFCEIAKNNKKLKWICIGSGEEAASIHSIVEASGLSGQVLMTGRLRNDQVINIYMTEGIKYFCNVSTTEGIPVSIMEAQSFGIPSIATDVGGTREIVNNENGLLLPQELQLDQLIHSLQNMITINEAQYVNLREKSRETWVEMSSAANNYKVWVQMLNSLRTDGRII